jgi:exonuclease SbcC
MNGKRKTEAYLHEWTEGRWTPVVLADGTRSDGKTDTYDACVEALLGTAETYFTSVFSAQGKRSLSDYRNSEIKTLLSDLLNLVPIRELGQKAADVARQLKAALQVERGHIAVAEDEFRAAERALQALGDVDAMLTQRTTERARAQAAVGAARNAVATAEVTLAAQEGIESVRARLQADLAAQKASLATRIEEANRERYRQEQRLAQLRKDARDKADAATRRVEQLCEEQQALSAVAACAGAVRRSVRRVALATQVVDKRRERIEGLREVGLLVAKAEGACATATAQLLAVEREAGQAALRAADLQRRLGLTGRVPCAGSDLQGRCELLGDANQAKALMPGADVDMRRLAAQRGELKSEVERWTLDVDAGKQRLAALPVATARLRNSEARIKFMTRMAESAGEVERAEKRLTVVATEMTEARQQAAAAVAGGAEAVQLAEAERLVQEAIERRTRIEFDGQGSIADGQRALEALPPAAGRRQIEAARQLLRQAEDDCGRADAAFSKALRTQENARQEVQRRDAAAARQAVVTAKVRVVEAELGLWSTLSRALSNDGVIALAIDDAGPTLASLTNDLLLACYGARFTVSIKTEVETAKGERREGFDIVVHDADNGEAKSVSVMSGGERVWINECLTRAIALYLAQNSGRRYGALFSDEADGPLDAGRKRMFMAMKREVLRIGGYAVEYYVSQTPELTAMADHVINVEALAAAA